MVVLYTTEPTRSFYEGVEPPNLCCTDSTQAFISTKFAKEMEKERDVATGKKRCHATKELAVTRLTSSRNRYASSTDSVEPPLHTSVTDELVQERVRTTWGRPCLYSICKVVSTWAGLHHPKINKRTRKGTGPHFGSNLEAESDGSDSYFYSKL